ncbi:cupin domain-containing protein [Actinoplanes sp. NPDC004185]
MKRRRLLMVAPAVLLLGAALLPPPALASPGSGFTAPVLVTANLDHKVKINSDGVKVRTNERTDVRVQRFVFEAGGYTGWHHHPGVVIIAVETGSLTFWDSQCRAKTYGPGLRNGSVLTESGDAPGQVTSTNGGTSYVTYLAPSADPPVFRIEDNPPRCPSGRLLSGSPTAAH